MHLPTMASNNILHLLITFTLLFSITTSSSSIPPAPPPETDPDDSITGSAYAFPPTNLSPVSASTPSFATSPAPAPAPAPEVANDTAIGNEPMNSSYRRFKGGKKAGIAIGVVAGACVVGLGGVLCKKRKQNVRRARLGYSVRDDFF